MAIDHFIPEVWSAELLTALETSLVYGAPGVVNRDYEGDIRAAGDTVRITSISDPEIDDYVAGTTVITPQPLTTAQRTLVVDQAKYFSFEVDDVDARQALPGVLTEGTSRAGYRLRDAADSFLAAKFVAGVQAANVIASTTIDPAPATGEVTAYEGLVRLAQKLDEADVPDMGRWAIVPAWFYSQLLLDERFTDAGARGEASAALNGQVGVVSNMRILRSNKVPAISTASAVVAGVPAALTYAEQINKVEAYRPENSFSDAVKGLHVYGAKVIRPDHIALLTAVDGTAA